ncbi:adenylate kinase [Entophlyctis luteolus]|nr:adenylate kinase [Entophlyctis luteolus]
MLTPPQLPAQPPFPSSLEQTIAAIPPARCVPRSQRPLLVFLESGPGMDSSSLARAIARELNIELISPDIILSAMMTAQDESASINGDSEGEEEIKPKSNKIHDLLHSGKAIDTSIFLEWYRALSSSDDAQFRGLAIAGLPTSGLLTDSSRIEESENGNLDQKDFFADIATLESILAASKRPSHCTNPETTTISIEELEPAAIDGPREGGASMATTCTHQHVLRPVLVKLVVPSAREDLRLRRLAQRVDPMTGIEYPGEQVEYSRRRRAEGWTDGTPDAEWEAAANLEDQTWNFNNFDLPHQSDSEKNGIEDEMENEIDGDEIEDDDQEDGDIENEGKKGKTKAKTSEQTARFNLSNKNAWPILPVEVLDRLLQPPECTLSQFESDYDNFQIKLPAITALTEKFFDQLNTVHLDVTQHPDILVKNKYLEIPPRLAGVRMCIIGGPFTGKTAQAKMLAKIYDLKFVSVDEILEAWDCEPNQQELKKNFPIYKEAVKRCKMGQSIAPETTIELIKLALKDDVFIGKSKSSPKKWNGWIIDGFPRTLEETRAMVLADLCPEYVVLLGNDINDERVRTRLKAHLADSRSGKTWNTSQTSMSLQPSTPRPPASLPPPTPNGRISTPFRTFKSSSRATPNRPQTRSEIRTSTPQSGISIIKNRQTAITETPSLPIIMFPYFDNLYNGFKEELPEITKLLETKTKLVEVAAEQAIPTILAIIQSAIDCLLPKAREISNTQIQEMSAVVELGSTKDFCPFALRQANILQKGESQNAVKYLGQIYFLSTEEAKYAFTMEPHNFVNVRQIMVPPPPRFFFLGPTGSGKSICMKSFESWGAPIIRFSDYVIEFSKTAEQSVREEIEYMIAENSGLFSPILVEDIILSLFKNEPYASHGFLLEGFPRSKVEAEVVVKHNMHVDAVVILRIEADVAAHRIISEKRKDAKVKRDTAAIELKANPNNKSALECLAVAEKELKVFSDEDGAMFEEFFDIVQKENLHISDAISTFESSWQVPLIEIDCNKCLRPVLGSLKKNCKPYFEYRQSLLSNAAKLEFKEAEILMRLGVKSKSPFGNFCPVAFKKNPSSLKRLTGTKPVIFKQHIYYLGNEESREEFIANTKDYISQPPPQPIVRPRIFILGRPKSGKSTLASRIAAENDLVHLTVPVIINSIMAEKKNLEFVSKISEYLRNGRDLPDTDIIDAVMIVTSRAVCLARGWILDGFPNTIAQALELENRGLIPHMVFEVKLESNEMIQRSVGDLKADLKAKAARLNYPDVSQLRDIVHSDNVVALRELYEQKYAVWIDVDGSKSKWFLKEEITKHIEERTKKRQNYQTLKTNGQAAPVMDVGLSQEEVKKKWSKFRNYCPVSLLDKGELVRLDSKIFFTAEFQGLFFNMRGEEELSVFLNSPEKYAYGPDLPDPLPTRASSKDLVFPRQLELQGYCPVSLVDGPPGFESILTGKLDILAEYDGKIFAFDNEVKLERFMRTPWAFTDLELPRKLPPKSVHIPIGQLPLIGYLEQTVATALTDALTEVGKVRPKFPYKSLTTSASEFLALYLKAKNSKSKDWVQKKYSQQLKKFVVTCKLISEIVDKARGHDATAPMSFIPCDLRPEGLDERLDQFFGMAKP